MTYTKKYRVLKNTNIPLPNININDYISRQGNINYDKEYKGYKNVVYTPLDLPKIDLDLELLWEVWKSIVEVGNYKDLTTTAEPWFDQEPELPTGPCRDGRKNHDYRLLSVLENGDYLDNNVKGKINDIVKKYFPDIEHWLESLPFDNIYFCAFVGRDKNGVGPHYDEEHNYEVIKLVEPSQIRARWSYLPPDQEHFYLTKDHGQTRTYPDLPLDTNSFCYDGTVHEHGADKGFHPSKRIQLMPMGKLNKEKWFKLLDKSIDKYKEYVITADHFNEKKL